MSDMKDEVVLELVTHGQPSILALNMQTMCTEFNVRDFLSVRNSVQICYIKVWRFMWKCVAALPYFSSPLLIEVKMCHFI